MTSHSLFSTRNQVKKALKSVLIPMQKIPIDAHVIRQATALQTLQKFVRKTIRPLAHTDYMYEIHTRTTPKTPFPIHLALAMELLHLAVALHDEIPHGADEHDDDPRAGFILLGDYCYTAALNALLHTPPTLLGIMADATEKMARIELENLAKKEALSSRGADPKGSAQKAAILLDTARQFITHV